MTVNTKLAVWFNKNYKNYIYPLSWHAQFGIKQKNAFEM
jgi:hypothetical protein